MTCKRGCCPTQRDHYLSVTIAPSAMPSRTGGLRAQQTNALAKQWDKDIPAYKRLVADGMQPNSVDGAADLEAKATSKEQVEAEHFAPIGRADG